HDRSESDLAEEIQLHIDLQTEDNVRAGMSIGEARRAARLKFGAIESIKESCRVTRGLPLIEDFFHELLHAVPQFGQSRGFTLTVVIALALCIGVNTAVFSVVHALLLRSLPFKKADRLMYVFEIWPPA